MAEPVEPIQEALRSSDPVVRRRTLEQFMLRESPLPEIAVALIEATSDSDETVAALAAESLENFGAPSTRDMSAIADLLLSHQGDQAYWAATLLGRIGAEAAPAVPRLTEALESQPSLAARERAAWALGKIGFAGPTTCEVLERLARGDQPRLARLAQQSLDLIRSS